MQSVLWLVENELAVWMTLGTLAAVGLFALVSPQRFASVAQTSGQWFDTQRIVDWFDTRFDVDGPLLKHSRTLGILMLVAVGYVAYRFYALLDVAA